MSGTEWLDSYTGQTTDELIALEDKYRTDSLVLAFEQALDQKAARVGMQGLTAEERVVLAVEAIEREVNNGGYDQLFRNSSDLAPFFVAALSGIGCGEVADLTQLAIDALAIEGSLTAEAIDLAMEDESDERDDRLAKLDSRYFEAAGDLAAPLLAFIKTNRTRIVLGR